MITLGEKVECKVTGFTGIAVARLEYLNGCIQYGVKPKINKDDAKMPDTTYIDQQQLKVIEKDVLNVAPKGTGGPSSDEPKHSTNGKRD
jgi:hypothetical protein